MKYIIPIIILSLVLLSCKSDEEESTTNNALTCTGTSSGSGPTIGSVTLEEATYLSSCFSSRKLQLEFKNSTSAQYTTFYYGDTSCSGTATSQSNNGCMESINVSSTTTTKPVYENGTAGDNATGYATSATWKHSSDIQYLELSGVSSSVFWYNQSSSQAGLDSNAYWLFKFTKQ